MTTLTLKSVSANKDDFKNIIFNGLAEEKRKLNYSLEKTKNIIKKFEKKYGFSTSTFLKKFKKGEIEETEEIFDWWAESKIIDELDNKLNILYSIEV